MRFIVPILLALAAIIHLLPVTGVLGAASLERLYGVAITDPNLLVLMRHRAVLFAIVGGVLIASIFRVEWRPLAIAVGLVSVVSFLLIAWSVGGTNALIARVVWVDVAALGMLVTAALLHARRGHA
jgi:hypothetical protein